MNHDVQGLWGAIALVSFFAIFLGVVIYTFTRGNQESFERARHLPLDENGNDQDQEERRDEQVAPLERVER